MQVEARGPGGEGTREASGEDHIPKFDGKARETQRDPEERKTRSSNLGKHRSSKKIHSVILGSIHSGTLVSTDNS